jgi:CTP:molybdopterin cytidylyltransferase MocA
VPLVRWPVQALRAGGIDRVIVTVGAHHEEVATVLEDVEDTVLVPEWQEGMSASLRAGVQVAAQLGAAAVLVVLADEPLLSAEAVASILAAAERHPEAPVIRASYDGRPGHPVLLRKETFAAVGELRGDEGARGLVGSGAIEVSCDGLGTSADIDTPEDLARLSGSAPTTATVTGSKTAEADAKAAEADADADATTD